MSALGQKQTYALQQAMSALHPIATAKGDMSQKAMSALPPKSGHLRCTSSCLLWANTGHSITSAVWASRMSGGQRFYNRCLPSRM
jgi:hypothetical protein